ncbi:hypothetical protein AMAG_07908 [Allomyces macrogynus ATCC 38327]|uniref:Uncharacterized protein n=1 Tax=Allomyces macrogynus (strain ATCC 38327) TaxID=578462 RepID=A0A0L0SJR1_ALLM3|nr:hypothetical protein AMAG_07908 [Allomyces macrogynus ATCC 38327]|eukprot:KNE62721.1 hypothetical protein AMAG_07908 [Allomyces macrogynus ATCC 38327]
MTPGTPLLLTSQEVEMVDQGCYFAAIAAPSESAPTSLRTSRAVSRAPSPNTRDEPMDIDIVVTPAPVPRPPALGRSATATAPLGRAGVFTRPYVLPPRAVSPPPPAHAPSPDVAIVVLRSGRRRDGERLRRG